MPELCSTLVFPPRCRSQLWLPISGRHGWVLPRAIGLLLQWRHPTRRKMNQKRQGKFKKKKKQGGEENHQKFPSTTRVHPPPCRGGSAGVWERSSPEPEVSLGFPMFPNRHRWRGRGWGERPRPSIAPAPGGGRARWAGSGPPSAGCRLPWGPRRSSGLAWCPWSAGSAGQGRARGQQHPQVCFFREESLFLPMGW